jgi:hypothetical protein
MNVACIDTFECEFNSILFDAQDDDICSFPQTDVIAGLHDNVHGRFLPENRGHFSQSRHATVNAAAPTVHFVLKLKERMENRLVRRSRSRRTPSGVARSATRTPSSSDSAALHIAEARV